jgi:hypothetical protein
MSFLFDNLDIQSAIPWGHYRGLRDTLAARLQQGTIMLKVPNVHLSQQVLQTFCNGKFLVKFQITCLFRLLRTGNPRPSSHEHLPNDSGLTHDIGYRMADTNGDRS